MSEVKRALKRIREHINADARIEALKEINDLLQQGIEEYNLFLFAGLVNSALDSAKAVEYYRKAIDIDPDNSQAWKGLYKHYTTVGNYDDFSLIVVDKLLSSFCESEEKTDELRKTRTLICVKLGKLDEVSAVDLDMAEICSLVVRDYGTKANSSHLQQLVTVAIDNLQAWGKLDQETHLTACRYHCQFSTFEVSSQWIIAHARQYAAADPFVVQQLLSIVAVLLQRGGLLTDADLLAAVRKQCTADKDSDLSSKLARLLAENNMTDAYNVIGGLSNDKLRAWPACGLSFVALRHFRQFHRIVRLYSVAQIPTDYDRDFQCLRFEAHFEICETKEDFEALKTLFDTAGELSPDLEEIHLRCLIRLQQISLEELDASMQRSDLPEQTQHSLRAAFHWTVEKDVEMTREEVRAALSFGEADVRDTLLSTEILIARKQIQPAIAQLTSAAQANPFNADLFRILSDALLKCGNLEKARSCAERAVLLNPASERAAKAVDEILLKQGADDETRMSKLEAFLEHRPHSRWALRAAALLEINQGKLDSAIEKLQKLTRVASNAESKTEANALWFFLGEAYKQKGNLQSAVRAFKAALEEDPNNLTTHLQLIQLYQGMGKYEEAIAEGATIREAGLSMPDAVSSFFEVLHLHSLVLSAADSAVFERQVELLREFFATAPSLLKASVNCLLLQKVSVRAFRLLLR